VRDPASMYARMDAVSNQLEWIGLTHKNYYPRMLHRIAGPATTEEFAALKTLADVLEPVKEYKREEVAPEPPTSQQPLTRVVDAVNLESKTAREFGQMVDKYLAASCHDTALGSALRAQLTAWRDNDARLQPLAQRSYLVKEVAPSSQDLSVVATTGLSALDAIEHGNAKLDDSWKSTQLDALKNAAQKQQYLLMPVPSIQKLVEAAASGGACAR
jgi:hexosaminidase